MTSSLTSSLFVAASEGSDKLHDFDAPAALWIGFVVGLFALLLIDLLVLHRSAHEISVREAAISSAGWVALGVAFSLVIWGVLGGQAAGQYLTGYVIEKSLSVDNVFVWAVIFSYFSVPRAYQHRVLFWGIFGALVLRAVFIFAGVALLNAFDWILFVFGGLLIFTAYRVATHSSEEIHPERNPVLKIVRRFVPVSAHYDGQKLFTKEGARRLATPLFVVLVLIEATDVVFAVDSVPAILAVSRDQFVVFSSNALAILGLRALYFLLAGVQDRLVHLNKGLGVILFYVGVKMLISEWYHIPTLLSLGVIALVLTVTVFASLATTKRAAERSATEGADDARGDDELAPPATTEDPVP
ncbi:MAG TPA: TerC family protein [Acidimicrobiia bacterium]|nr:TerC family protein [Acidimicrobiia bacterium]